MDWICALAESLLFDGDRTGEDRSGDSTGQSQGLLRVYEDKGSRLVFTHHGEGDGTGWSTKAQGCFLPGCFTKSYLQLLTEVQSFS